MSEGPARRGVGKGQSRSLQRPRASKALTLRSALLCLALLPLSSIRTRRILSLAFGKRAHGLLEVVLPERSLFVNDEMDTVSTRREEVVLERCWSVVGVDDVAGLLVGRANPLGELHGVGDRGGEEDVVDLVWKEDDSLFPDDSTLCD